jgi:hypothetical protein
MRSFTFARSNPACRLAINLKIAFVLIAAMADDR